MYFGRCRGREKYLTINKLMYSIHFILLTCFHNLLAKRCKNIIFVVSHVFVILKIFKSNYFNFID